MPVKDSSSRSDFSAPSSAGQQDFAGAPRLARELQTVQAMILIYCQDKHGPEHHLCTDCLALLNYAGTRLMRCRFGPNKPTCARCPVHCYTPRWRDQVKQVMRYAGPRMLWRHPVLSWFHWVDGFRSRRNPAQT